jgi:hypothetical protein
MKHLLAICIAITLTATSASWAQSSPNFPAQPSSAKQADIPVNPKSPPSPKSPLAKLWPADTIPVFVLACAQFHKELIAPCKCTITKLMVAMPHDEFLALSAENAIEQDQRYLNSRRACIGTPRTRQ